jgi:hypothetical protein
MTSNTFAQIAKKSTKSYHQQKAFIKKVLVGKVSHCPVCKQVLTVKLTAEDGQTGIYCAKKCTDIALDIANNITS